MSTFSDYYAAVKARLDISTVLAAALDPSATQADHVRLERYACISKSGPANHDAQLDLGPNIYLIPGAYEYSPRSEQHGRGEANVEMDVHWRLDNTSVTDMKNFVAFVDDLCVELMTGSDGTGGATSWLSPVGGKLRCFVSQQEQLSMTEIRAKVRLRAMILPVV